MIKNKLSKELFTLVIQSLNSNVLPDPDFLYEVYDVSFSAIEELISNKDFSKAISINSLVLVNYILGEYTYALEKRTPEEIHQFVTNEKNIIMMASVVSDKYMVSDFFPSKGNVIGNKYLPPISSLDTYLNFLLNVLSPKKEDNPRKTLLQDMLYKTLSMMRCVLDLLTNGFETEAMALWRTVHESECILILLGNNDEKVKESYVKHIKYANEFKKGRTNEEETDLIFKEIKESMKEHELKSKDMKKFIEYGWLYDTKEYKEKPDIKLNFRDGLEVLAGLADYSKVYEETSELIHSTPWLIYSSKLYFYLKALTNTYESFFRVENVFDNYYLKTITNDALKFQYMNMKNIYYRQLIVIHKREKERLENLVDID